MNQSINATEAIARIRKMFRRATKAGDSDWRQAAHVARDRAHVDLAGTSAPAPEEVLRQSRSDRVEQLNQLR